VAANAFDMDEAQRARAWSAVKISALSGEAVTQRAVSSAAFSSTPPLSSSRSRLARILVAMPSGSFRKSPCAHSL